MNTRIICLGFAFFCLTAFAQEKPMQLDLMPMPAKIEFQAGKFRLTDSFKIAITGNSDKRFYSNATRALRRLGGRTGLILTKDFLRPNTKVEDTILFIQCTRSG